LRYIPLLDFAPDAAWVARAEALLERLKAASDTLSRNDIIAKNSTLWGELKEWLLTLSHGKCWFSEAKDCFSHLDVEHYRPKTSAKDADGTTHDGYWWLAFDWRNFRICGNAGNRMKSTFFPLRPGCTRIGSNGDTRLEDPQLLDPTSPADPALLSFDFEGNALPAADVASSWDRERVTYSVQRCKLDFPPLASKRKLVWAECWNRIEEYRRDLAVYHENPTNDVARHAYTQALKAVRGMMQSDVELSAVARACVMSSGDPRVIALLRSA
jgi:hypothetical protein